MGSKFFNYDSCNEIDQLYTILENLNNCIAIYKAIENGNYFEIFYVNKAVEQIEKVNRKDILGKNVIDVFPNIKEFGLFDIFQKVFKSGISEHHPTAFYKDGRIYGWRDNQVSKLSSDKIVAIYTDETKNEEVKRSLRESEFFFRTVFETIQDGITVLNTDMNIIKMNHAMEQWYMPTKPYLGKKCYHVYHDKSAACDDCPAKKAIESGRPHFKIVNRGGPLGTPGWIELSAFPIINNEGITIGAVEYVRNVTARKKAEEELRNSEQHLKEIINFLPDPTWAIDDKGIIIQWNRSLELLTNRKASEMIGKGNYEYALPFFGKRRPMLIDLALYQNKSWEKEYKNFKKEGNVVSNSDGFYKLLGKNGLYLSATASPLYNANGEIVGAIETIRDITEKKLLEQKYLHAEKLSAVGKLSASFAHEFGNPLLGILFTLKKLKEKSNIEDEDDKLLDMAISEGMRIKDLIRNLQDFNRPSTGKKTAMDVHKALDSILMLQQIDFNSRLISVVRNYTARLPEIFAVSDQIKQVFLNLLANAADACDHFGGSITVRTWQEGDTVAVAIQDSGIGIKQEDMSQIFQPFFSTKSEVEGTGLGLSVSHAIIQHHGGEIRVESQPGIGSTFTVFLPITAR